MVPDVLDLEEVAAVRRALLAAIDESERRGVPTHFPGLDPNKNNVRVFNLLDLDAVFRELILHPAAVSLVSEILGQYFMISNFTANIALPGSKSMAIHSDQAIVVPEPWHSPWSMNIIWCLDDVHAANGATQFLPGSHRLQTTAELPENIEQQLVPFEASAGSVIAMDGRLWHTSGANVTEGDERALLFGYYSSDFLRPQVNWNAALSAETMLQLSAELTERLGLGASGNLRHGNSLIQSINKKG